MSKGGGGGPQAQPSTSTVNQSSLPEYAEPYFKNLMDRTETESLQDFTPYEGQRIADFGTDTTQGFDQMKNIAGSGQPQSFATAETATTGVANGANMAQQGQYGSMPSFTDAGVAQQYMNPYVTNVLDNQTARANQRFDEQQLTRNDQAQSAGAFGGDRRFVGDQIANRERNQQLNEMDQQGLMAAYESGAGIFAGEQGRELQNRGLNTEIFSGNQNRMLQQDQNRLTASDQLMQQGITNEAMGVDRAKMLTGIGAQYDEKTQAGLDAGYSDFLNQRDAERQNLNFYSGIMRGVPTSPNQEATTYNAPPSQLSQLLGLGVGGLGLAKAFG